MKLKSISLAVKNKFKRHKDAIKIFLPFLIIMLYYTIILVVPDTPEQMYNGLIVASMFVTILVLYLIYSQVAEYRNNVKAFNILIENDAQLSKNQKQVYELLVRFNEAMQTVAQHNATEKIRFENELNEQLKAIDLIVNLTDERTKIIQANTEVS